MTRVLFLALALVAAAILPARAQAPPAAATVASVRGPARVLVLPGGGAKLQDAQAQRVLSLDTLAPGSLLQLAPGSSATLVYDGDGHREDLSGPCVVRVTPAGSQLVKGAAGSVQVRESEAAELLPPPGPVARVQVAPGTVLAVTQKFGMPAFSWRTSAAGPCMVAVYQPGPPRVNLWSSEVSGSGVQYDGPVLVPDTTYVLQLEAGGAALGAMRFQVPSDHAVRSLGVAQAEIQRSPDPAGYGMLALSQDRAGDLAAAVRSLQAALDQQPDDLGFLQRMQAMVTEMGDEAQAHALQNRAKFLEDSVPADMGYSAMDAYVDDIEGLYLP